MWPKEKPYSAQLNIYCFYLYITDKILRHSKFCKGLICWLLLYFDMCKIYFPILPSVNIKHIQGHFNGIALIVGYTSHKDQSCNHFQCKDFRDFFCVYTKFSQDPLLNNSTILY